MRTLDATHPTFDTRREIPDLPTCGRHTNMQAGSTASRTSYRLPGAGSGASIVFVVSFLRMIWSGMKATVTFRKPTWRSGFSDADHRRGSPHPRAQRRKKPLTGGDILSIPYRTAFQGLHCLGYLVCLSDFVALFGGLTSREEKFRLSICICFCRIGAIRYRGVASRQNDKSRP